MTGFHVLHDLRRYSLLYPSFFSAGGRHVPDKPPRREYGRSTRRLRSHAIRHLRADRRRDNGHAARPDPARLSCYARAQPWPAVGARPVAATQLPPLLRWLHARIRDPAHPSRAVLVDPRDHRLRELQAALPRRGLPGRRIDDRQHGASAGRAGATVPAHRAVLLHGVPGEASAVGEATRPPRLLGRPHRDGRRLGCRSRTRPDGGRRVRRFECSCAAPAPPLRLPCAAPTPPREPPLRPHVPAPLPPAPAHRYICAPCTHAGRLWWWSCSR